MALLQTLGPFVQTMAVGLELAEPYTIGPFVQPLSELEAPLPPAPDVGGGPHYCPPGYQWDPFQGCCIPCEDPFPAEMLPDSTARTAAAKIGLVISDGGVYESLAADLGLIIDDED